ncbi:5-hydroxyisourate hydrolase [Hartmannibacter diazotrophicus]|uniref:5-hydroxyisourate hydrolase n=1 Tax=Hartmannibacter diazotrophicus TaxID=1482074 RepID=A0A2C9DA58_9HYPH|nr:hydroxyisourate hydrolase [Hartmannibacter diazotrophicus]SON56485.1 5-hydroxyisourate hydrolase [Hartmannibacter diazotrophicus]
MGRLTTHVLDAVAGTPAAGLSVALYRIEEGGAVLVTRAVTNEDGRIVPLVFGDDFVVGVYELHFLCGPYFHQKGVPVTDPPFLDTVPIRFGIADATQHFHVPLLMSPYSYSTYRGS